MFQTSDCTYTACSYIAINAPSDCGVSASSRIRVLGRPPGYSRCGSSLPWPLASASVCASRLAISAWWLTVYGSSLCTQPMKSAGITLVPWCSAWKKLCCTSVPAPPHHTDTVSLPTGLPSSCTRLPRLSITSCCR